MCHKSGPWSLQVVIWMGMILFALIFLPDIIQATPENGISYVNRPPQGNFDNFFAFITKLIIPNIPGALILFIMSSLFSGINFYTAVQMRSQVFKVLTRYLCAWILFNYAFALLVLLLILPDNLSLSTINKNLFVYCLVATAMPEVAANLRLQLGNSSNAIDLYKYKTRVSDLITDRLRVSVTEQQNKQLTALAFSYYGRLNPFLRKLAILRSQDNLTQEEINDINAMADELKARPVDGNRKRVMDLEKEYGCIIPKLIQFYQKDIQTFLASPAADLLDNLNPLLEIVEARSLVAAGITNTRRFLWHCKFKKYRINLSKKTNIDINRLNSLYHSTLATRKKRRLSRLKFLGIIAMVLILAIGVMYSLQMRGVQRQLIVQKIKVESRPFVENKPLLEKTNNSSESPYVDQGAERTP